jgi:hypothetical protein
MLHSTMVFWKDQDIVGGEFDAITVEIIASAS